MAIYNKMTDLRAELNDAIESKNSEKFLDVVNATAEAKAEAILADALKGYDNSILTARGKRQLTSQETKYYNSLIGAMKQSNYKDAVRNLDVTLPDTVIESVFDEIETEHEVLKHLDVQTVKGKMKLLYAVSDNVEAVWTTLNGAITAQAAGEFDEIDPSALKLSAFIPVSEPMLDLGPEYIDRFVRTILYQSVANGLEKGVLTNLVSNSGPIGMMADMNAGTTASGVTTYTAKTATAVTKFTPKGLAGVLAGMAKDRSGNPRALNGLFMVVNPTDYYTKVRPAICVQNSLGEWVEKLPVPMTICQSKYVASGKAILGLDKKYIVGVSTAEAGKIEKSDEYDFINDNRTYKIKLYGNGQPKDNNAFAYLDISGLEEAALLTNVVNVTTEQ